MFADLLFVCVLNMPQHSPVYPVKMSKKEEANGKQMLQETHLLDRIKKRNREVEKWKEL